MHSNQDCKLIADQLHVILFNMIKAKEFKTPFIVPHYTISMYLYSLRFWPKYNYVEMFYKLVELGYNPMRRERSQHERILVHNIFKIVDILEKGRGCDL